MAHHTFEGDEALVDIVEYKGEIFIATTRNIYRMTEGVLIRLEFIKSPDDLRLKSLDEAHAGRH